MKVINFHEINSVSEAKWFEKVISLLKSKDAVLSCDDLRSNIEANNYKSDGYLLTVDDGHESFREFIFPIIKKYNVPITLFVSPKICKEKKNFWFQEIRGYDKIESKKIISEIIDIDAEKLDKINFKSILKSLDINTIHEFIRRYKKINGISEIPPQNVTVDDLRIFQKSNLVTIGAHTMNHPILKNETDENSKFEIKSSIEQLSDILNKNVHYFAYPNGIPEMDYSIREMQELIANGILMGFSTKFKPVSDKFGKMEVPRGEITDGQFGIGMKLWLWEYWRELVNLKNGDIENDDRKRMINLIESK
ncbi:polysaccharide deacetylase family protein [Lutimonas saemankumensis]|uniref:polysaccharide deacetylase family protein n=1 Tax=Lutimonas saemankumensis TaxID=483016 RepID=UPI001CD238B9|nr:polysaccharide deacetylase family protein [Lutimonas saemankumensis]MCA0931049.1 polysaccharide deacetylase family protein [Lutimonas saemankumensis]